MSGPPGKQLLAAAAVSMTFLAAAWLLLVPVTAVFLVSTERPEPYQVSSLHSWWTSEQNLVFSDTGLLPTSHLVQGIRLDCGNALTTGVREPTQAPAGPRACAQVEAPRRIAGLCLLAVAVVATVAARRWWSVAADNRNRYRMPYAQRRALRRSR